MDESCFVDWLKAQRGVRRAEEMSPELLSRVEAEESNVMSVFGTPVDNAGMRDCLSRGKVFVAFVEGDFWVPPTTTMVLRDSAGREIGRDIPYSLLSEYEGRQDLIFISDNFVMYEGSEMSDAPYMEMLSQDYCGEDGSVPESCSAVLWFPSPSSSTIIHDALGQPDTGLATAMIGINLGPTARRGIGPPPHTDHRDGKVPKSERHMRGRGTEGAPGSEGPLRTAVPSMLRNVPLHDDGRFL